MSSAEEKDTILDLREVQDFFKGKDASSIMAGSRTVTETTKATKPKRTSRRKKPQTSPEEEVSPPKKRTKMERYQDDLRELGLSVEDAAGIVDALVSEFSYSEEVRVTRKLEVVFKTRTPAVNKRFNTVLAGAKPQNETAYYTFLAQVNLAASLVRYAEEEFNQESEEGFTEALDFVERLPQPLFALLTGKLNSFDRKIAAVMQEGCIENL